MTREEFDNMDILDQINYINEMLSELSLTKICEEIGISRAAIVKRFRPVGYVFDNNVKKYIKEGTVVNEKSIMTILKEKIEELNQRVTVLEQERNENITDTQQINNSNSIRFYKNDTTVRAYRIDNEIYQRFKDYTDENRQFKISDIISTALEDFLNKVNQ